MTAMLAHSLALSPSLSLSLSLTSGSRDTSDVHSALSKFCAFSTLNLQLPPTMPVLGLADALENLLKTLNQSSGLSSWKISSLDKSATTVVLRFAGPQCQPDARATRFRRAYPPQLRRDGVRREAFVTRKAADNCSLPPCPPPQSVQPPSCDSVTTTSQQDVTAISSQTTKSTSYSTDQNVAL